MCPARAGLLELLLPSRVLVLAAEVLVQLYEVTRLVEIDSAREN